MAVGARFRQLVAEILRRTHFRWEVCHGFDGKASFWRRRVQAKKGVKKTGGPLRPLHLAWPPRGLPYTSLRNREREDRGHPSLARQAYTAARRTAIYHRVAAYPRVSLAGQYRLATLPASRTSGLRQPVSPSRDAHPEAATAIYRFDGRNHAHLPSTHFAVRPCHTRPRRRKVGRCGSTAARCSRPVAGRFQAKGGLRSHRGRTLVDGSAFDVWYDGSGNRLHLIPGDVQAHRTPRYHEAGGVGLVRFQGAEFLGRTGAFAPLDDFTLYLVTVPRSNKGRFQGWLAMSDLGKNDYDVGLNLDQGPESSDRFAQVNVEAEGLRRRGQSDEGIIPLLARSVSCMSRGITPASSSAIDGKLEGPEGSVSRARCTAMR